jgi:hypothetical protein
MQWNHLISLSDTTRPLVNQSDQKLNYIYTSNNDYMLCDTIVMTDTNIFIHPEYKKRLSVELQDQWMSVIDYDDDYFPIALDPNGAYTYYVNVNTISDNFNKVFFLNYDPNCDPLPLKMKGIDQLLNHRHKEHKFSFLEILFGICVDQERISKCTRIIEFGG